LVLLVKPCKESFINNTDGFILGLLTLHGYLILDFDWYSSFYTWIALISAYLPFLIICFNLIPLLRLKAAVIRFCCCKKIHRFEDDEIEGEESAIDEDRDKLLYSFERELNNSSGSN
jgi:hypothetical protein